MQGGHSVRGSFHGVSDGHLELTSGQSLLGNGFHYSSGSSSDNGSGENSNEDDDNNGDEDDDRVGLLSHRSNSSIRRSASGSFNSSFNGSFSGPPGSKRRHRRRSRSGRLSRNSFNQGYATEAGLNELLASMRPDKGSFARSGRGSSSSWARGRPVKGGGESGVLALDPTEAAARAEEAKLAAVEVRRLMKEGGLLPSEAAHEAAALVAQRRESRSFNLGSEVGGAQESKQQDENNSRRRLRMESVESAMSLIENPNEDDEDDDDDDEGPHRSYMKKARSLSDASPSLQRHVELVEDAFLDSLLPSVREEEENEPAPEVKPKSRLSSFFGGSKKDTPPPPPASPPKQALKSARPRSASGDEPPEGSLSLMVRLQPHGLLGERLGWNGKTNATAVTSAAENADAVLLEEHVGQLPSAVPGGCVVVDPLGLHNLAAPKKASSGGGGGPAALVVSNPDSVSAALYAWLGCEAAKRYPSEVPAGVRAPGDAKLTKYPQPATADATAPGAATAAAEVVHCAVPDLRRELFQPLEPPYSPHDVHELLSQAYASVFREFASTSCQSRVLRLLPVCAATSRRGTGPVAVAAGSFAPALPVLTWAAMQVGR